MGGYDEESLEASSTASYASELSSPPRRSSSGKKVAGEDGEPLRPIAGNTPMEIFAGGIAAASVASAAAAMILQPVNVVFAAGGLSWYVSFCIVQIISSTSTSMGLGLFTLTPSRNTCLCHCPDRCPKCNRSICILATASVNRCDSPPRNAQGTLRASR